MIAISYHRGLKGLFHFARVARDSPDFKYECNECYWFIPGLPISELQ